MTPLKEQALEKILVEMDGEHSVAVEQIHNWLCTQDGEDLLNGIMAEDKTINHALAYCRGKAKESAKNGVAMIEDTTVYGWVKEYFTTPDLAIDKPIPEYTHETVEVPEELRKPADTKVTNKPEPAGDATEPEIPAKKVGEQLDIFDYLGE